MIVEEEELSLFLSRLWCLLSASNGNQMSGGKLPAAKKIPCSPARLCQGSGALFCSR